MPPLEWPATEAEAGEPEPTFERDVVFELDGSARARARRRSTTATTLRAGQTIAGPAVIEQYDSTTVVPPGLTAEIDRHGNIVIDCTGVAKAADAGAALSNPVLMRVIGGAFQSIAKEMGAILFRISYSSIIRESEDLGAGLFDVEGNEIAESDSTPMFMGAMPKIVKGVIRELGLDGIHEGDIIAHNHPYKGATHTPDIGIVVPIFWEGELVAFSGASAHLVDIGGAYPGMAIDLVDIWSEGHILDAIKLSERGVRQESVWKMMLTNVRAPTLNRGDIEAMIAACERGKERLLDLLRRYGKETVLGAAGAWLDYSERMLRQEIAKVPDGVYEAELGYMDDDGKNRGQAAAGQGEGADRGRHPDDRRHRLERRGRDRVQQPLRGRRAQRRHVHRAHDLPRRGHPRRLRARRTRGCCARCSVIAPKGSIFNPSFPRATKARFCQIQRMADFTLQALAPAIPEKITAGNSASTTFLSYSGFQPENGGVLDLPRGQRGLARRQAGRRRLGLGGLARREHAQQPDRGARVALPDADGALRAARRLGRSRASGAAASARCASTASSPTRSSPARATASSATRRGASSAGIRG